VSRPVVGRTMSSIAMPRVDGEGTGQSANAQLLRLVARANANVAELMRLSDFVPKIFYLEGDDARLYGLILQDYAYFQRADLIEEKLAVNPVRAG
jgi:WASH complex subunit strumpellin